MAGDWTKMRDDIHDDPAVVSIGIRLGLDVDTVAGKLLRVWSWAGRHTVTGKCAGVTLAHVDNVARAAEFGSAMVSAGWLRTEENGDVVFPRWGKHNGKAGKKRALAAERASRKRARDAALASRNGSYKSVPRAEQSRAEGEQIDPAVAGGPNPSRSALLACPSVRDALRLCDVDEPALSELSSCAGITQAEIADIWGPIKRRRKVVNKPGTLVAQLKKNHSLAKSVRGNLSAEALKACEDIERRKAALRMGARS